MNRGSQNQDVWGFSPLHDGTMKESLIPAGSAPAHMNKACWNNSAHILVMLRFNFHIVFVDPETSNMWPGAKVCRLNVTRILWRLYFSRRPTVKEGLVHSAVGETQSFKLLSGMHRKGERKKKEKEGKGLLLCLAERWSPWMPSGSVFGSTSLLFQFTLRRQVQRGGGRGKRAHTHTQRIMVLSVRPALTQSIAPFHQFCSFVFWSLSPVLTGQLQRPDSQQTHTDAHWCTHPGN